MGQLTFAPSDIVYLDTAPIIYSVENFIIERLAGVNLNQVKSGLPEFQI